MPNLLSVRFDWSEITNQHIRHLSNATGLVVVSLQQCRLITNLALYNLQFARNLRRLNLKGCQGINDWGTKDILFFTDLRVINVSGTKVTSKGVDDLKMSNPDLKILE